MATYELDGVRITTAACRKRGRRAITRTAAERAVNASEGYNRLNARQRLARIKRDFGLEGKPVRVEDTFDRAAGLLAAAFRKIDDRRKPDHAPGLSVKS